MGVAPILSILICTYNREDLLEGCLLSLSKQNTPGANWNILIVNNYTNPLGNGLIKLIQSLPNASTISEPEPGLSIARNSGIASSDGEWVAFLDDDAKVPTDYVQRILSIISNENFDCFGGAIQSWWRYGRPKWLDTDYGSKSELREGRGVVQDGYNWGSNIVIRRSALESVGGFPEYIGMKGYHVGYAAENIVQDRLRENGFTIGYDPELMIEHVVAEHKLKLSWHIKAAYATGRDGRQVFPEQYRFNGMMRSLKSCFSRPIRSVFGFLLNKNYPWQKTYLEIMIPWALLLGKMRSKIL